MVYDILEVFKKMYQDKKDNLILGGYTLKDGLYVKIKENGICEYYESKTNSKRENSFSSLEGTEYSKVQDRFKEWDYYSSYLNSNKALFDKKIHNINYLSMFFKVENSEYIKGKLREHFLILLSFKKFKDKNEKDILKDYENRIKSFSRKKDIVKKYRILISKIDEISQKAKELGIKNYIKIFFDEDLSIYKKESEIYLSLKIFNDIKYNKKVENEIFGLSNANMGLNSKKPFLENKTKKLTTPFLLEKENALMLKMFFDWLKIQGYRNEKGEPIDRFLGTSAEQFYIQKQSKNDEAEIIDFDYIPLKIDEVNKNFESIYVKNHLGVKLKDGTLKSDYEIKSISQLEVIIDNTLYNKQLIFNYFKDEIKTSSFMSKELQQLVYITKNSMLNYFRKYDRHSFVQNIDKYGTFFVLEHMRSKRANIAKEALNLKLALLKHYKGEEVMDIEVKLKELNGLLEKEENYPSLKREDFLFLAGQWAYYLLSKSKAYDRSFSFAEQYFRAKYISRLQKVLNNDLEKYKHEIYRDSKKIKKIIALTKSYETDNDKLSDKDKDIFLIGFTVESLFYKNTKNSKNDNKMEEK